ncbi:MAG: hypothetical protein DHS20C10_08940 [marine bacterium B5-7]|nr:MAG: hypothetical protein DHS20C10_08940 [marine bacterium B5-7]
MPPKMTQYMQAELDREPAVRREALASKNFFPLYDITNDLRKELQARNAPEVSVTDKIRVYYSHAIACRALRYQVKGTKRQKEKYHNEAEASLKRILALRPGDLRATCSLGALAYDQWRKEKFREETDSFKEAAQYFQTVMQAESAPDLSDDDKGQVVRAKNAYTEMCGYAGAVSQSLLDVLSGPGILAKVTKAFCDRLITDLLEDGSAMSDAGSPVSVDATASTTTMGSVGAPSPDSVASSGSVGNGEQRGVKRNAPEDAESAAERAKVPRYGLRSSRR